MNRNTFDDELLTLEQVAQKLQIHTGTIYRYVREKKLRAIRLSGRDLRIRRSELRRFLNEREIGSDTK